MAGYLFQIKRLLHHLAEAESLTTIVGIESLDDVVVIDGETIRIQGQDKIAYVDRFSAPSSEAVANDC